MVVPQTRGNIMQNPQKYTLKEVDTRMDLLQVVLKKHRITPGHNFLTGTPLTDEQKESEIIRELLSDEYHRLKNLGVHLYNESYPPRGCSL